MYGGSFVHLILLLRPKTESDKAMKFCMNVHKVNVGILSHLNLLIFPTNTGELK